MITMYTTPDMKLEVGSFKNGSPHFYHGRCRCGGCLSVWTGHAVGEIKIKSHDGKRNLTLFPPQKK